MQGLVHTTLPLPKLACRGNLEKISLEPKATNLSNTTGYKNLKFCSNLRNIVAGFSSRVPAVIFRLCWLLCWMTFCRLPNQNKEAGSAWVHVWYSQILAMIGNEKYIGSSGMDFKWLPQHIRTHHPQTDMVLPGAICVPVSTNYFIWLN